METKGLYNGKTIEQIEDNMPDILIPAHKEMYLNNCREVIRNEAEGYNLNYCQRLRDSNFMLIEMVLTGKY